MTTMPLSNLRQHLQSSFDDLPGEAARLFHGRGHCYEGLSAVNVDWFEPVVWVVVYGEVEPDFLDGLQRMLIELAQRNERVVCVSLQQRNKGKASQWVIYGDMPATCRAQEGGASFELNFSANQNIGFFLDARPGRQWLQQAAEGKRVLNLFSYTCSFSVAALRGGAANVVNIDMAKSALASGQRNHALNGLDSSCVRFLPHDIFRSMGKLQKLGPYDLVVIDPPSRQKGSFEAEKDYARLLKRLPSMLAPNAQVLACLNAPHLGGEFLPQLFAEYLPALHPVERLPQRQDFPERDLDCCLKMQLFSSAT
jgi:23S rRNA (cytosine1962-C5)-methyltransferase